MLLVLVIEKATVSVLSLINGLCGGGGSDAFLLTISPRVLLSPTKAFPVNNDFLNSLFVDCVLCTFLGLSKIG